MTVRELRDLLKAYDGDYEIILSSDSEGNKLSPLEEYSFAYYSAESEYEGSLCDQEDEEQVGGDPVIVLWPRN